MWTFRNADRVIQEVHGVQHQHEVGLGQQNHDIFGVEVDDISKLNKPLHITHVYRSIFQGESKFRTIKAAKGHREDPGPR